MTALTRMECPRDDDFDLWLELLEVKASTGLLDALGDFLRDYLRSSVSSSTSWACRAGSIRPSWPRCCIPAAFRTWASACPSLPTLLKRSSAAPAWPRPTHAARGRAHPHTSRISRTSTSGFPVPFRPLSRHTPVAEGNLKARTRMLFLYHVAQLPRRLRPVHGPARRTADRLLDPATAMWATSVPSSSSQDHGIRHGPDACSRLADPAPLQAAIDAVPRTAWASAGPIWTSWRPSPTPRSRTCSGSISACARRSATAAFLRSRRLAGPPLKGPGPSGVSWPAASSAPARCSWTRGAYAREPGPGREGGGHTRLPHRFGLSPKRLGRFRRVHHP